MNRERKSGEIVARRVVDGHDVFTVQPAYGEPFDVVRLVDANNAPEGGDFSVAEQLSELMRGLEIPASAVAGVKPHGFYSIGAAIAAQAKRATYAPEGGEAVAWMHVMHCEHEQKITRYSDSPTHDFGIAGRDYSPEYTITSHPLYTRSNAQGGEAKLDKPALVGHAQFGVGISWSTVIGAAQRAYEWKDDKLSPEQIAAFYIAFPHLAPSKEKVARDDTRSNDKGTEGG